MSVGLKSEATDYVTIFIGVNFMQVGFPPHPQTALGANYLDPCPLNCPWPCQCMYLCCHPTCVWPRWLCTVKSVWYSGAHVLHPWNTGVTPSYARIGQLPMPFSPTTLGVCCICFIFQVWIYMDLFIFLTNQQSFDCVCQYKWGNRCTNFLSSWSCCTPFKWFCKLKLKRKQKPQSILPIDDYSVLYVLLNDKPICYLPS